MFLYSGLQIWAVFWGWSTFRWSTGDMRHTCSTAHDKIEGAVELPCPVIIKGLRSRQQIQHRLAREQ